MALRWLTIIAALTLGAGLLWFGASELFVVNVQADANGTAGSFPLLPSAAALIGFCLAVGSLCAAAWQLGKTFDRNRANPGDPACEVSA